MSQKCGVAFGPPFFRFGIIDKRQSHVFPFPQIDNFVIFVYVGSSNGKEKLP